MLMPFLVAPSSFSYVIYFLITPYIRILDSDWLIAVIFFLQIQALHCEFAEFLLHVGVFA